MEEWRRETHVLTKSGSRETNFRMTAFAAWKKAKPMTMGSSSERLLKRISKKTETLHITRVAVKNSSALPSLRLLLPPPPPPPPLPSLAMEQKLYAAQRKSDKEANLQRKMRQMRLKRNNSSAFAFVITSLSNAFLSLGKKSNAFSLETLFLH